jgi:hypothetical protein
VGSGAHCANAGPATKNVATIALVCNAHMRTRRFRDVISPTFMHSPNNYNAKFSFASYTCPYLTSVAFRNYR